MAYIKRTSFKNKIFYWVIIAILSGLLIWNVYLTIHYSNLLGLMPIVIQGSLLTLIFTKHEYAKVAIKWWVILILITASGLQFVGRLFIDLNGFIDDSFHLDIEYYLIAALNIIVGFILLIYINDSVEVVAVEEELI